MINIDKRYSFKLKGDSKEYKVGDRYLLLVPELLEENLKKMTIQNSLLKINYKNILHSSAGILVASKYKYYGVIDKNNNIIVPFEYSTIILDKELLIARKYDCDNKKVGVFDLNGKEILPANYNDINVSKDLILAKKDDLYSNKKEVLVFDRTGKKLLSYEVENAYLLFEDTIFIQKKNKAGDLKWEVRNKENKNIIPFEFDRYKIPNIASGMIIVYNDNKIGVYDKFGNNILPMDYYNEIDIRGNIITCYKNNHYTSFFYTKNKNYPIDTNSCNSLYDDDFYVAYSKELNGKGNIEFVIKDKNTDKLSGIELGLNKKTDNYKVENQYGIIILSNNDFESVMYNLKTGKKFIFEKCIDTILHKEYELFKVISSKQALYDLDGNEILPPMFKKIDLLDNKNAIVEIKDEDYYLLNFKNLKELSKFQEETIKFYSNQLSGSCVFDLVNNKFLEIESWDVECTLKDEFGKIIELDKEDIKKLKKNL